MHWPTHDVLRLTKSSDFIFFADLDVEVADAVDLEHRRRVPPVTPKPHLSEKCLGGVLQSVNELEDVHSLRLSLCAIHAQYRY